MKYIQKGSEGGKGRGKCYHYNLKNKKEVHNLYPKCIASVLEDTKVMMQVDCLSH